MSPLNGYGLRNRPGLKLLNCSGLLCWCRKARDFASLLFCTSLVDVSLCSIVEVSSQSSSVTPRSIRGRSPESTGGRARASSLCRLLRPRKTARRDAVALPFINSFIVLIYCAERRMIRSSPSRSISISMDNWSSSIKCSTLAERKEATRGSLANFASTIDRCV